eukprot:16089-Heterococcus_DN1.PRE.3
MVVEVVALCTEQLQVIPCLLTLMYTGVRVNVSATQQRFMCYTTAAARALQYDVQRTSTHARAY